MSKPKTQRRISLEIERSYKRSKKLLLESMKETLPGSRAHMDHINALATLDRRYREERAERGLDAQDLGTATRTVYRFVATVSQDGAANVEEESEERKRLNAELDAEYFSVPDEAPKTEPKSNRRKK